MNHEFRLKKLVMPAKAGIRFFSYIQYYSRVLDATSRKKRAAGMTTFSLNHLTGTCV